MADVSVARSPSPKKSTSEKVARFPAVAAAGTVDETLAASGIPPPPAAAAAAAFFAFSASAPPPAPSASARSDSASSFAAFVLERKRLATLRAPSPSLRAHASRQHAALNASCRASAASGAPSEANRRTAANLAASAAATPSGLRPSHARVNSLRTSALGASFTPPRAHAASTRLPSSEPSRRKTFFAAAANVSPRLSAVSAALFRAEDVVEATDALKGSKASEEGADAESRKRSGSETRKEALSSRSERFAYASRKPNPSRRSSPPHVPVVLRSRGVPWLESAFASPMMLPAPASFGFGPDDDDAPG